MTMRIGCIDVHEIGLEKTVGYDVVNSPIIIFDSEDKNCIEMILKKASDKKFRFEYRSIVSEK